MLVSSVQQSDSVINIQVSILFQIILSFRLLQNIEWSSQCYTIRLHLLSILYIVVYICAVCSVVSGWLFAAPWTVAYQVPLSMAFSRQEYRSGLPLPSPLTALEYYLFSSDRAVILTFQISQVMPSWLLLNSLTVIISTSRFILYPSLNYSINDRIILLYICTYI